MKGFDIRSFLGGVCALLILTGCDDKNGMGNPCSVNFDQKVLFTSVLQDQILPGYNDLVSGLNRLQKDFTALQSNPSTENLDALEDSFIAAYHAWKRVEIFNFGPAEDLQAIDYFNLFPLNVSKAEEQLDGGFDPDKAMTYDKGFPALDYFIFHKPTSEERLDYLTREDVSTYFTQVLQKMQSVADGIQSGYSAGYSEKFTTNTGTVAGTSLSLLVNALSQYFENNRRDQLGIPSGAVTLDIPNPDKTEGYYSSISLDLVKTSIETAQLLYDGTINGAGISAYLYALEDGADGEKIAEGISIQFDKILKAILPVDAPLSIAVTEDREDVATLYRAMSDQVINLKTDLPSRMCISITYVDNPSDTD